MISAVTQRPRARLDLLERFVYFGEQASVELAKRYFAAVEATCLQLVDHSQSGVLYDSGVVGLKGLRRFPVKGFENYLPFYLPHQSGIDVIRASTVPATSTIFSRKRKPDFQSRRELSPL